ncbi:MAG: ABC transporter ATP-binding protein [Candidatus Margulisbacteria bacterium]|nr:ABC transporter ATP-binding protein [Candidatus Margulisiibacteriota bacterium]
MNNKIAIQIKNLTYKFDKKTILSDIKWEVNDKDVWLVLGPNGAGKTTLLKCLSGQLKLQSGSVFIKGKDIAGFTQKQCARNVAYLPQKPVFNVPFTVKELLQLSQYAYQKNGLDQKLYADALLAFRIEDLSSRYIQTLSGGELQKVMLAGVYLQSSGIVCLDEPFSFLDPTECSNITNLLGTMFYKKKTLIMVIHNLHPVYFTMFYKQANILMLKKGQVFYSGPLKGSLDSFEDFFERKFKKIKIGDEILLF